MASARTCLLAQCQRQRTNHAYVHAPRWQRQGETVAGLTDVEEREVFVPRPGAQRPPAQSRQPARIREIISDREGRSPGRQHSTRLRNHEAAAGLGQRRAAAGGRGAEEQWGSLGWRLGGHRQDP